MVCGRLQLFYQYYGLDQHYGNVLLTTTLFQYNPHCGIINDTAVNNSNVTVCEEKQLDTNDYLKIMWTAGAELPGLLVTMKLLAAS